MGTAVALVVAGLLEFWLAVSTDTRDVEQGATALTPPCRARCRNGRTRKADRAENATATSTA
jgi:hypothetical protein